MIPVASYAKMAETSAVKDTSTAHWELMGIRLDNPFLVYPDGFPAEAMDRFEVEIGRGWLANFPVLGTVILGELGEEHMRTGKPIIDMAATITDMLGVQPPSHGCSFQYLILRNNNYE